MPIPESASGVALFALQRAGEGFVLGELFQLSNGFSRPTERARIDPLGSQPKQSWTAPLLGENKNLIENPRMQPSNALSPE